MSTRIPFVTLYVAMNHRRYIGCTVYCVVQFNQTGCNRNVAGGRLPPLRIRWWVVSFNRTGCNRNVAGGIIAAPTGVIPFIHTGCIRGTPRNGTQAVPYGFADTSVFQPSWFKNVRFFACKNNRGHAPKRRIVNCQLSIVNFDITVNWYPFHVKNAAHPTKRVYSVPFN